MSDALVLAEARLRDCRVLRHGALAKAFDALDAPGEETRLVGGAVRDLLLGAPPGDFDLATTALPQDGMRRAQRAGLRAIPTGVEHGTFTLLVDGKPIEVTTLREDVETFGRHARVRFGRDFGADAERRDFTINALSLDRAGRLYDYCGGLADLEAGRVRFIGDARARIREDYLRILRFLRFCARFCAGSIDAEGLGAAIAEREGLAVLSRERVRAELLKLLVAPRAAEIVAVAAEAGLIGALLGAIAYPSRLERCVRLEAQREEAPDGVRRLAALAVVVREDAERLREGLRLSNAESARLEAIAGACEERHGAVAPPTLSELWALLFERGRERARDALTIWQIDAGASGDPLRFLSAYRFVSDTPPPRRPFSGADILARGVGPGERVGAALKKLQALWIRAGFPREPETLSRLIDEATRE